jgi:hypothetical protein
LCMICNHRAILRAYIWALSIFGCRIMDRPEYTEEVFIGNFIWFLLMASITENTDSKSVYPWILINGF